jgi:diadenylate cyclase
MVVATWLSGLFHLYTLNWILQGAMTLGLIALVVVFQPELRRALERMGRGKWVPAFRQVNKNEAKDIVSQFVRAIESASQTRLGMLIVFERQTSLTDICETGTIINSNINAEIIGNIFYEGAPLHDGAVVVRGRKLYAARCVLPLTENKNLSTELGTRHRAGIGITEKSDALVIIVSEETGIISMAKDGNITRYLDAKSVEKDLLKMYLNDGDDTTLKNVKKAMDKVGGKKDV